MDAVEVDLHIDAEPQDVWDYAMDPAGTTEWVTIVRRVEHADDGPLEVGYRMDQRLCLRGVPFTVKWRLVEVDAPRFARWEGRGPARSKAVIEDRLEPERGGTRFTYTNEFHTPFGALGRGRRPRADRRRAPARGDRVAQAAEGDPRAPGRARAPARRLARRASAPSARGAPALASGSLRLPHLGDCTHDGQPDSHGHSAISRCASPTSASKRESPGA